MRFLTERLWHDADRASVGTWTIPESTTLNEFGIAQSHSKQMADLTLTPDHRFTWSRHGGRRTDFGRWQLRGRYLISEFSNPGKRRKVGYPYRDRIIKLTPQELVYVQGEDAPGRKSSSNQAIQRTAGRSAFELTMTSTFNIQRCAASPAVADLESR